VIESIVVEH